MIVVPEIKHVVDALGAPQKDGDVTGAPLWQIPTYCRVKKESKKFDVLLQLQKCRSYRLVTSIFSLQGGIHNKNI